MKQPNKPSFKKYAKFSGLAFQWIAVFTAFSLGGNYLDERQGNQFPGYTLAGVFIGLVVIFYSLYKVIQELNQEKPQQDD